MSSSKEPRDRNSYYQMAKDVNIDRDDSKQTFIPKKDSVEDHQELVRHSQRHEKLYRLKLNNEYLRCLLAEFLGTFVLVSMGVGTVAQLVLSSNPKQIQMQRGNIVTVNLGWGIAIMMGIYASGGVSGGHINPAVTLAFAVFRKVSWKKVPFYFIGQYLGAFMGAVAVYLCYFDALNHYDGGRRFVTGKNGTAGIWSTFPEDHVSTFQGFIDQAFATGLFILLIFAITDEKNMKVPSGLVPLAIGLIVVALTTGYQFNCGAALNPARDLSPRIFTLISGWGAGVFSFRNYNWFWVPVIGPHLGALVGAALYFGCVQLHWPRHRVELETSSRVQEMKVVRLES